LVKQLTTSVTTAQMVEN